MIALGSSIDWLGKDWAVFKKTNVLLKSAI
jgi:hypothetical protein